MVAMPEFHSPPKTFRRGEPLLVEASPAQANRSLKVAVVHLRFRRVNQAEVWQSQEMEEHGIVFRTIIPGDYTNSAFPLQYHFEIREASGAAWLFPGLKPGWRGQPYFVVRQG